MSFPTIVPTSYVTTGNVRTTYDPSIGSMVGSSSVSQSSLGDPRTYQLQTGGVLGLKCPLGSLIVDVGGPDSVSGTYSSSGQLPTGQIAIYKYVLYKSATNPAVIALPGVVYYTDETGTVVSGSPTDGYIGQTTSGAGMDTAGIMMVNSGDLSTLTATLLNPTNGSGVWICISGFVKSLACLTGGAAGDYLFGNIQSSGTQWTVARVANGGTLNNTSRPLGYALTAKATVNSANAQDAIITLAGGAPY